MSPNTCQKVLVTKQLRYRSAGKEHKIRIICESVELSGYYRRAIRPHAVQTCRECAGP